MAEYKRLRTHDKKHTTVKENIELMKNWDYRSNRINGIDPSKLTCGMQRNAYWICEKCGSSYKRKVYKQYSNVINNKKNLCTVCGKFKLDQQNNLLAKAPEMVRKYWDFVKNNSDNVFPDKIAPFSNRKVYIYCKQHNVHTIQYVPDLALGRVACPECQRKYSSLRDMYPEIADELADGQGDGFEISPYSNKIKKWFCPFCGKIYPKKVCVRTKQGQSCPYCYGRNKTSKPQIILYNAIKILTYEVELEFELNNLYYDIYLPKYNIAIEYDGKHFHDNTIMADKKKCHDFLKIENNNIIKNTIIRIREEGLPSIDMDGVIIIKCYPTGSCKYYYLLSTIQEIFYTIKNITNDISDEQICLAINVAKEKFNVFVKEAIENYSIGCYICNDSNNLTKVYPGLNQLYIKNKKLEHRYKITVGASNVINCICNNCGYEFKRSAKRLVSTHGTCPKCHYWIEDLSDANAVMVRRYMRCRNYSKSLKVMEPEIAKLYSQNNKLKANEIYAHSTYIVQVKCPICQEDYSDNLKSIVKNRAICVVGQPKLQQPRQEKLQQIYA